jgi:hypothetical protein
VLSLTKEKGVDNRFIAGVANLFSRRAKKRAGKTLEGIFNLEN